MKENDNTREARVAKKYSGVTRASKGVASQNQPLRFAAARGRIRNTNLSETPAVTCHLHIFPRPRLDGALGKIFGNFRRRTFSVLLSTAEDCLFALLDTLDKQQLSDR